MAYGPRGLGENPTAQLICSARFVTLTMYGISSAIVPSPFVLQLPDLGAFPHAMI
jgi:hypothetical protein